MTNRYELYGQLTFDGGMTWQWSKLSKHKTREAAIKAAAKNGKNYRAMKIHSVDVEHLPRWFTKNK